MEEASRKATAEGLKHVAKALASRKFERRVKNDSDSVSESESENLPKKHRVVSTDTDKLETRIHYLNLDLANSSVLVDELRETVASTEKKYKSFLDINDLLDTIDKFYKEEQKSISEYNLHNLEERALKFNRGYTEFQYKFNDLMNHVELPHLKLALRFAVNDCKAKGLELNKSYSNLQDYKIFMNALYKLAVSLLLPVIYAIYITSNSGSFSMFSAVVSSVIYLSIVLVYLSNHTS